MLTAHGLRSERLRDKEIVGDPPSGCLLRHAQREIVAPKIRYRSAPNDRTVTYGTGVSSRFLKRSSTLNFSLTPENAGRI